MGGPPNELIPDHHVPPNGGVVNGRQQTEHIVWSRRAAWSPLWWWPCRKKDNKMSCEVQLKLQIPNFHRFLSCFAVFVNIFHMQEYTYRLDTIHNCCFEIYWPLLISKDNHTDKASSYNPDICCHDNRPLHCVQKKKRLPQKYGNNNGEPVLLRNKILNTSRSIYFKQRHAVSLKYSVSSVSYGNLNNTT